VLGFGLLLQTSAADLLRPEPRNALSESHEGTPSASVSADVDRAPIGAPIPRRVMRARRDAAEALGLASVSELPTWSVAPAPAYGPASLQDAEKL